MHVCEICRYLLGLATTLCNLLLVRICLASTLITILHYKSCTETQVIIFPVIPESPRWLLGQVNSNNLSSFGDMF